MPPGASLSPPVLPRAFSRARKPRVGAMGAGPIHIGGAAWHRQHPDELMRRSPRR